MTASASRPTRHAEVIHLSFEASVIVQGTDEYGRGVVEQGIQAYLEESKGEQS